MWARTQVTPQEWARGQPALCSRQEGPQLPAILTGGTGGLMWGPRPHQDPLPHVCAQERGGRAGSLPQRHRQGLT